MPSCRNCGTTVGDSDNFCPHCATPQTDEADRRLSGFIDERATQLGTGAGGSGGGGGNLRHRLQYALGYLAVVVGLSTLTAGSGVFFLLAGLVVLPPIQDVLESRLGKPIGSRPTAVAVTALSVLGAATFIVV
jgi:hypothetical protein